MIERHKLQVPLAENLANMLLQPKAAQRMSAEDALRHHYFAELPPAIYDLGDGESVGSVRIDKFSIVHMLLLPP